MAKRKIVNPDPIHSFSDDGLPIKNSFSMLEAWNLVKGNWKYRYRKPLELYPWQILSLWNAVEATCLRSNKELYTYVSRQSGKTVGIGQTVGVLITIPTITSFFHKENLNIPIFAPKKEQSRRVMREVMMYYDCGFLKDVLGIGLEIDSKDEKLFTNGVYIKTGTANTNAKPEGDTAHALFLEEVQDIDDIRIKKSCFPMTANTGGPRCLSGTATPERRGYFASRLKTLGYQHPDVVYANADYVKKFSPTFRRFINAELASGRLSKDSIEYRTQFMLEWVDFENRFVDEATMKTMRDDRLDVLREWDGPVSIGLDIAKRMDTSVATVVQPTNVGNRLNTINWEEFHGRYTLQAKQTVSLLKRYPSCTSLVIDTFGAGEGFTDILMEYMEEGGIDTSIIIRKPFNPVNKSQVYKNLKRVIDNRQLYYPGSDIMQRYKFEEQMLNLIVEWGGNNINPSAPKGLHDDYPDSLALACWGLKFYSMDVMEMFMQDDGDDSVDIWSGTGESGGDDDVSDWIT